MAGSWRWRSTFFFAIALALGLLQIVGASSVAIKPRHEHHDEPEGPYEFNFTNEEPLDRAIKWHAGIQIFTWGLLFPAGMILGITKSRFHVPLQTLGCILTLLPGNFLGHHHGGRSFHTTAHSHFSSYMWWYVITQACLGIFLKLHLMEGSTARRVAVIAHGVIGKSFPVVGWVQMIFGGIAMLGFCFGEHFGQCLAHFIMGSSFIAYAFIMLIMLRLGAGWLSRRKCSQEYIDCWVIMIWGIVNFFTEHDFLRASGYWSHKDMQHVSLGLLWWCGGALGILLGRENKRNVVPGLIMAMTGYAMSAHEQPTEFSTRVHTLFGFSLVAAGAARIIEICFVLNDGPASADRSQHRAWQHLPPYFLVLSGLTFLSATEEQVHWIAGDIGMDASTYANILFSASFIIYAVGVAMVELYERSSESGTKSNDNHDIDVDVERGEGGGGGRRLWGVIPLPASAAALFPGSGRSLTDSPRGPEMREHYESVPLTSASRRESEVMTAYHNRSVFDLGEEEEATQEDDGGDGYWVEGRPRGDARPQTSA